MITLLFAWIAISISTVTLIYGLLTPRSIIFSLVYTLPLLLSSKAILDYTGYDHKQRKLPIIMQRILFITLTQSIPSAALLSWSPLVLLSWVILCGIVLMIMRFKIKALIKALHGPESSSIPYKPTLGLYHPHAHQRAGGEMVLWRLVHALNQSKELNYDMTIFSNVVPEDFFHLSVRKSASSSSTTPVTNDQKASEQTIEEFTINSHDFQEYVNTLSTTTTSSIFNSTSTPKGPSNLQQTNIPTAPEAPVDPVAIPGLILDQVESTFGIDLHPANPLNINKNTTTQQQQQHNQLYFHFLSHTALSDSGNYPRLTLILQTINAFYPLFHYFFTVVFFPMQFSGILTTFPCFILDTAGYPIVSLLCWCLGIPCGSYVHYPIIQHDMIARNLSGTTTLYDPTSNTQQTQPPTRKVKLILRHIKHYYFTALCQFYTFLLSRNTFLLGNGTWTFNHLNSLLGYKSTPIIPTPQLPADHPNYTNSKDNNNGIKSPIINQELTQLIKKNQSTTKKTILGRLYPPCNVPLPPSKQKLISSNVISNCHVTDKVKQIYPIFVSLGQYRPEKQQLLMLDAFISLLQHRLDNDLPLEYNSFPVSLFFIGTFRPNDKGLIQQILDKINTTQITKKSSTQPPLNVSTHIKCFFNLPLQDLKAISNVSLGGLHAMIDEHFGIAVVELLSMCYTIIGHRSAGPYLDIIVPAKIPTSTAQSTTISVTTHQDTPKPVGYTASTREEYTIMMNDIIGLYQLDLEHVATHTTTSSQTPSCQYISPLLEMSLRGQERAYDQFSFETFDHNVDAVMVPLLTHHLGINVDKKSQ